MDIICTCSSCNARFKVGEQAAGKKARCPKCSTIIAVPPEQLSQAGQPAQAASAQPAPIPESATVTRTPDAAATQASASQAGPFWPPSTTGDKRAESPETQPTSGRAAEADTPSLAINFKPRGSAAAVPAVAPAPATPSRKAKINLLPFIAGGGIAVTVLALAVGAYLFSGGNPEQAKRPTDKKAKRTVPTSTAATATLVVEWPESERDQSLMDVDGKNVPIPKTGPIEVKINEGDHKVNIFRVGYEQIVHQFKVDEEETESFSPKWNAVASDLPDTPNENSVASSPEDDSPRRSATPTAADILNLDVPGFEGWNKDLGKAKRLAREEKKDILLVIGSSDGSPRTARFAKALKAAGLPEGDLAERFVPLVLDLPTTEEAAVRLSNVRDNVRLALQYFMLGEELLEQLPLLVLADDQGRPYAVQREWSEGFDSIVKIVTGLEAKRAERDKLLAELEAMTDDPAARASAAAAVVQWILDEKLVIQYRNDIRGWYELAKQGDAENEAGKLEVVLEAELQCQLRGGDVRNRVQLAQRLEILEPWLKMTKFVDDNRGVRMHMLAGQLLMEMGDSEPALAHLERAKTYTPTDPELKAAMAAVGGLDPKLLGSGTGFVIAEGGYLLTNNHVAGGEGNIAVRIPTQEEPVPAELIHASKDPDIALIKAEFPEDFKPKPLALSNLTARVRTEVTALGYPRSDALGNDVITTYGRVSRLPNARSMNMLMLDMTVHPGNSGGPLCDDRGNVIGMVTAKTNLEGGDNFGMAITAKDLEAFLKEHLPSDAVRTKGTPARTAGKRKEKEADTPEEDIFEAMSQSVLMVLKLK